MTELWLFLATIAAGAIWLLVADVVLRKVDKSALRIGLWLNGVSGREADEIIDWHESKR